MLAGIPYVQHARRGYYSHESQTYNSENESSLSYALPN